MNTSLVLAGILIIIITSSTSSFLCNHAVYAHTFSQNENTLFITIVHQIEAQVQLAENNFPTNTKLAQQHAIIAIDLLNQKDPIVNNTTWSKQIAERNPRIATELTSALNSLKSATITISKKPTFTTTTTSTVNNTANDIITKVNRIGDLLGEAVSSRISKEILNNSTIQALVLARLANEIYFSYGRALGESAVALSEMAGTSIPVKGSLMNMSMSMSMKASDNAGMSSKMSADMTSGNNTTIKNITEYQTAQSLAAKAQQVFNKNLKPIAIQSKVTAATIAEIENDLDQLKVAIDNKAPFMDIMKLVHVQLHPILITAYNLPLKSL